MLNLSIMPLKAEYADEICEDIIEQQRTGVSTHALFMMKFNPEGTPAVDKAAKQCAEYDIFREKLDRAGARHGVLVQATLGHITVPYEPYPFQPSVFLSTGEDRVVTCCPMDPDFQAYIRAQMRTLARRHPSVVMIDDDIGLLYKPTKGCACRFHMAELSRRAGREITREELYAHTQGDSAEDRRITALYTEVQRDGLVSAVRAMRAGLDDVDPTIQGIVSGIYTTTFLEFSGDTAEAFAGRGNPRILRLNGGPYGKASHRYFTDNMYRAALIRENTRGQVDIYLAETDTCPQNRYSTSAALLHAHFTASILEGAVGAKHWITRLAAHEPASGRAYRRKLAEYSAFYEKLTEYVPKIRPFGCRIPLTLMQDFGFRPGSRGEQLSSWSTNVLERFGLPLYFSNEDGGAVFLDEYSADTFDDAQIRKFLSGTLILSAGAADILNRRGFGEYTGVTVRPWQGKVISSEIVDGISLSVQYKVQELCPASQAAEALSYAVHRSGRDGSITELFPAVVRTDTPSGGECIVFAGTPDMPFKYFTAFSMLNETRKRQFVRILSRRGHLPVYYPEDGEVYLRAGRLDSGEIFCAFFNTGFDILEDIPLVCTEKIRAVEVLNSDGTRSVCTFRTDGDTVRIALAALPHTPVILFLQTDGEASV